MWYGSATTPIEFFGPTRYQWDSGYFQLAIERNVQLSLAEGKSLAVAWQTIPYRLAFFDYLGNNPAKGGLFRNGPMNNGDGIALGWSGHAAFLAGDGSNLFVRRMPSFFETFPVLLVDSQGTVRADIPFRRAESKYSIEQVEVSTALYGGVLSGSIFSNRRSVTQFARRAQLGELVDFDRETNHSDGVFRTGVLDFSGLVHGAGLRLPTSSWGSYSCSGTGGTGHARYLGMYFRGSTATPLNRWSSAPS